MYEEWGQALKQAAGDDSVVLATVTGEQADPDTLTLYHTEKSLDLSILREFTEGKRNLFQMMIFGLE